ncbi:hypothetical protein EV294_102713 [Paenibacillus sp. BK033]|uniref:hypothetical protein n=1 Tax=Paenibacillus sp. BK033 TaxID=2512133 RepID=UPI00104F6005|nr:hypothetical protein [Paenibacillus sp. BK033]TCM99417.1 hypothetical protein EV294_102713 [Paenibacillus sp. BK033]
MKNKNPIPNTKNLNINDLNDAIKLLSEEVSTIVEELLICDFGDEGLKHNINNLQKNLEYLKSEITRL